MVAKISVKPVDYVEAQSKPSRACFGSGIYHADRKTRHGTISDRVKAVAQALIATAGTSHAVTTSDIRNAADFLHRQFAEYSKFGISTRIASEINRIHRPGTSGSL